MIHNNFFISHGKYWLDGQVMVAAADGDGVYLSIDFGETWAKIDLGVAIVTGDTFAGIAIQYTGISHNFVVIAAIRNKGIARYYHYQGYNYQVSFYPHIINFNRMKKTEGSLIGFSDGRRLYTRRYYDYMEGDYANYAYDFQYTVLDYSGSNGQEAIITVGEAYVGNMYFNNNYNWGQNIPTGYYFLIQQIGIFCWAVGPGVIAKSIDNYQTWSYCVVDAQPIQNGVKYNLAGHEFHDIIMLATNGKVYRCQPDVYSPAADIWTDCQLPTGDYYWVDVALKNIALTAKYGGKIMVTHDNGITWTEKYLNKNWSRVAIANTRTKRY